MKSTSRPPPETLKEIKNDVDLCLDNPLVPPKLSLPNEKYSLWVEKPIGNYEPYNLEKKKKQRAELDVNRVIKKKWKPEPTT